jgi:hypothetical protein
MSRCVGIKRDGLRCSATSGIEREHGGIRCATHWRILSETINIHGVEDGLAIHEGREGRLIMDGPRVRQHAEAVRVAAVRMAQARADLDEIERRAQARVNINAWEGRQAQARANINGMQDEAPVNVAQAGRNARIHVGRLERIANDNQNVHTREMVDQTKDIVNKIRAIPVPVDYQWNVRTVSKTPGEIICDCKLSINAARIMMDKYTLSDDIYEMGGGIYGKVLDGVWQYIKNSKDKNDLCKILTQELKENIGMCLQGNLSRLCNVLAGYMDGIGSQESVAEILGREFAIISKLEDENEKIIKANKILDDNKVTDQKVREEWIGAL